MTSGTASPRRRVDWSAHWLGAPLRSLLSVAAGVGLALSFARPGWWALLVPALGLLFALAASAAPARALVEGFVGGGVFFGLLLRWFSSVLLDFTSLGAVVSYGAAVAAGAILGSETAVVAWTLARWARRTGAGAALAAAPFLWTAFEVLRERFPLPFPWGVLSAAWAQAPGSAPAAAAVGGTGLSLTLAVAAALFAALLLGGRRSALFGAAIWAGLFLGLVLAGRRFEADASPSRLTVAVVQGAVPVDAPSSDKLTVYRSLTEQAAERGAKLVVWPESAVELRVDADPAYREALEDLAARLDVDLVVGSTTAAPGGGYFNSNVLVRPDRGLSGVQPKRRLVPFGEYIPARFLFGQVPALASEVGQDFQAGRRAVILQGRHADVGALVCFEAVFPELAHELVQEGADVLANTTNDSWYGHSAGPRQHLQHALLRAAENGRPLLRAANSGVSALVDRRGRVLQELPVGARGALVAEIERGGARPPGARVGEWIARGCAIFGLAALVAALLFRGAAPADAKNAQ